MGKRAPDMMRGPRFEHALLGAGIGFTSNSYSGVNAANQGKFRISPAIDGHRLGGAPGNNLATLQNYDKVDASHGKFRSPEFLVLARAFPDPMKSDLGSRFLFLRVFANSALRVFTRTGIHFA
jgi:hypothetical protein